MQTSNPRKGVRTRAALGRSLTRPAWSPDGKGACLVPQVVELSGDYRPVPAIPANLRRFDNIDKSRRRSFLMPNDVKWWQYPPDALALASKMRTQGHFWPAIAKYLYTHFECPYFEPDWLSRAVRAAATDDYRRPASTPKGRDSAALKLPPPPRVRGVPPDPPAPPVDLRADWVKEFPDQPWPGEERALAALMRAERRRR
jgi:hypothetical protein